MIAQLSLLHYQTLRPAEWKPAKLLALTSHRWWAHRLSKQSLLALGFPAASRGGIWRLEMGFWGGESVVPVLFISWPLLIMYWTKTFTFSTEAPTEAWLCSTLMVAFSAKSDFAPSLFWVFSHHCSPGFVPRLSLEHIGPAVSLSCLALATDAKMLQARKIMMWHVPSRSKSSSVSHYA